MVAEQDLKVTHPDFLVLGFPCNQFNNQDPGSNDEIQNFCQVNYGVTFPVLGKIDAGAPYVALCAILHNRPPTPPQDKISPGANSYICV